MTSNSSSKTPELKDTVPEQWNKSAKSWNDQSARVRGWLRVPTDAMLSVARTEPVGLTRRAAASA
jgi:hypothetical protein